MFIISILAALLVVPSGAVFTAPPQRSRTRVTAARENITTLVRHGQDGYAAIWDGNRYVQRKRISDRSLELRAQASDILIPRVPEHQSLGLDRKKRPYAGVMDASAIDRETGQAAIEPAKLIGPMLARLMATDRAFAKERRSRAMAHFGKIISR